MILRIYVFFLIIIIVAASIALLPRVLDEQHPSRPVIMPIITRNWQIRDIDTEIRTALLSLNRLRGHLVLGNTGSIVTPSVIK